MADKHPYISGTVGILKALEHFRSSLPGKINATVLKKLGIAPKNESYLINILKFLKMIDEQGVPTPEAKSTFSQNNNSEFAKKLSEMIKNAYTDLFSLHGDNVWTLDHNALITYFRESDQSSDVVGGRQATTFQTLAALAGHGEVPSAHHAASPKGKPVASRVKPKATTTQSKSTPADIKEAHIKDFGLTVRIEINLPAAADQETYDRIFRSIKENLLNG